MGLALHRRDADGAAAAVVPGVAQRVVFQLAEIRQYVYCVCDITKLHPKPMVTGNAEASGVRIL